MGKRLKNATVVQEDDFGVCLWRMPDGEYLGDGDGNFLSLQGRVYDVVVQEKMRKAAVHYMGEEASEGSFEWVAGARQISDSEHDDQMDRLLDGKIPDPVDALRQLKEMGK